MSTIRTFGGIKSKHNVCRGENCMGKFCEDLRKNGMKIINF